MQDSQVTHPARTAYAQAVSESLQRLVGLDYEELVSTAPSMESKLDIDGYHERDRSPDQCAEAIRSLLQLRRHDGGNNAIQYNLFQLAMREFVNTGRWTMGEEGEARVKIGNNELRMEVVQKGDKTGFAVRPINAPAEEASIRLDIVDAVQHAVTRLKRDKGLGAPAPEEAVPANMGMR